MHRRQLLHKTKTDLHKPRFASIKWYGRLLSDTLGVIDGDVGPVPARPGDSRTFAFVVLHIHEVLADIELL